ncbi:Hypothetical protein NGAL_HAMBI2427_33400 [Neorhizobium galegae bv. orientalis]|nr:Hypothetical protein NGAL_HAMBI2427_33400 [Neorhizobium galegae bv. orientalis]
MQWLSACIPQRASQHLSSRSSPSGIGVAGGDHWRDRRIDLLSIPMRRRRASTTDRGTSAAVPTGWKMMVPISPAVFASNASSFPMEMRGRTSSGWYERNVRCGSACRSNRKVILARMRPIHDLALDRIHVYDDVISRVSSELALQFFHGGDETFVPSDPPFILEERREELGCVAQLLCVFANFVAVLCRVAAGSDQFSQLALTHEM